MTETLAEKTCTPCRGGIPPLTHEEAERFRAQASDWELRDDAHRIERTFRFRNFREAGAFVQEISELAEAEGHHPDISFGWGYATVGLQTKKIKGLHENDFIMATKIDQIFDRSGARAGNATSLIGVRGAIRSGTTSDATAIAGGSKLPLAKEKPMSSTGSDLRTRDTGRDMSCSVICEAFLWGRDCDA